MGTGCWERRAWDGHSEGGIGVYPSTDRPCDRSGRRAGADGAALSLHLGFGGMPAAYAVGIPRSSWVLVCIEYRALNTGATGETGRER